MQTPETKQNPKQMINQMLELERLIDPGNEHNHDFEDEEEIYEPPY
ncbi:hypothetical protein BH09BAC2_BH09BAC2_07790 [soil metagenome]